MPSRDIVLRPLDPTSEDAARLLRLADAYAHTLYPPESNHLDDVTELGRPNVTFVGAYAGAGIVGCGAAKVLMDDVPYGEIKRVFVLEEHRGKGAATSLMRHLEEFLRGAKVEYVRLETGIYQADALALYRKLGYVDRGPFGAYVPDPLSVFMEKRLA